MVKIRDARLGVLSYTLTVGILIYIVLYQLVAKGGYLVRNPAMDTVRLTLQQPTESPTTGKACNPNGSDCDDNFTALTELNYCWQTQRSKQGRFSTLNCTYMDGGEAAVVKTGSIMMTTAVHQYSQSRNKTCKTGANTCRKLWDVDNQQQTYIVDPEGFTLLLDHSLTSSDVKPPDMKGLLYVPSGTEMQKQICAETAGAVDAVWEGKPTKDAPCYVPPFLAGGKDFFSIGYLLRSQGVSLDDQSDEPGSDETKRLGGLIFNLMIDYSNFYVFSMGAQSTIHYTYELNLVPGTGYKESRFVSTTFPISREKIDLHGILFNVQASGELASFDFTNLLLQLTTSLTLFAVVSVAMNFLAQYVLAYSRFYKHLMYQVSHDFSNIRDCHELTDEQVDLELTNRGASTHGDRVERVLRLLEHGWQVTEGSQAREVSSSHSLQSPLANAEMGS